MSYDEYKEMCRNSWGNGHTCLCFDRTKKKEIKEGTVFVMKAKTHINNASLKRNIFDYNRCYIQLKIEQV